MSLTRRQFLKSSLAFGALSATAGLTDISAFAACHNPTGEGIAELFNKFEGNVVLLAGKYSGTVQAMDLAVPETLAWFPYGLTGMDMPIAHHIAAMPSADTYRGFDFYQTFQPPMEPYIDENTPHWRHRGDFQMYKMRFDGSGKQNRISVVSDIPAATGMGLGVHV